ncbi:hypothetical protein [Rhodoblastus sp.]|uniref:hypothetical protein n=1 Tax=Rhodoblastus sp. TaxID=1962975 RepID=UPI00261CA7F4|nr:hypothetical protein [Rhodoblastus sp.]
MKYRAPEGVTALFCAGETFVPDQSGLFEAGDDLIEELAPHGCAAFAEPKPGDAAVFRRPARGRSRCERVN